MVNKLFDVDNPESTLNSLLTSRAYTYRETVEPHITNDWVVCIYKPVCIHNYSSHSTPRNLLIHLVTACFHFTRHFSLRFRRKFVLFWNITHALEADSIIHSNKDKSLHWDDECSSYCLCVKLESYVELLNSFTCRFFNLYWIKYVIFRNSLVWSNELIYQCSWIFKI